MFKHVAPVGVKYMVIFDIILEIIYGEYRIMPSIIVISH